MQASGHRDGRGTQARMWGPNTTKAAACGEGSKRDTVEANNLKLS